MNDLLWTPETRARVAPRRGHGVLEPWPTGSVARAALDASYRARRAAIVAGVKHGHAEQAKAIAYLDQNAAPHAVSAAAAAVLVRSDGSIVDAWLAEAGAAFAVMACASTSAFAAGLHRKDGSILLVAMKPTEATLEIEPWWHALRRRLATMPDADYAAARDAAAALLAKTTGGVAIRLVHAFPDEASWSAQLARALLDQKELTLASTVLSSLSDAALVDEIVTTFDDAAIALANHAFDLADALGPRAESSLRVIAESAIAHSWGYASMRADAFAALALIPSSDIAQFFAKHLDEKDVRAVGSAYLKKLPELGRAALLPRSKAKKPNEVVSALLRTIERAGQAYEGKEAASSELPAVLAAPPWSAKRTARRRPTVLGLTPLPFEETISARAEAKLVDFDRKWPILGLVPRYGLAAIPRLLEIPRKMAGDVAFAAERVVSPRIAPVIAHALFKAPKARAVAERWLLTNTRAAAIQLLVDLTGKDNAERETAARALRFLARRGKQPELAEVAEEYGNAAVDALRDALGDDSLEDGAPPKPPKLPAWLDVSALPRPVLEKTRAALPEPAVRALVEMLIFTPPAEPYEGLEHVRDACDAASLGEFAWAIFESWAAAGYPANDRWAFFAVGHFGTDPHAHRLAQLIRVWPTEGGFARAVLGLDVLATMKSDIALMLLHGISERVKSRPLLKRAREKMDAVAQALGLTTDDLADRLVPTLGLDDDGSRRLDFGPRQFRVGFDEYLRPFVLDSNGKKLSELPKVGASDDTEKANAATNEWKAIKKNAKTAAAAQLGRLENAMIAQRRWEPSTFATFVARHPLVGHLARRLAFGAYDASGKLVAAFRVAEDGSYADEHDATFAIPEGGRIGVLHPLEVDPGTLRELGQRFADYEILQPFPQVGREIARGVNTDEAMRFRPVDTLKLLALERRGWRRGPVGDGGRIDALEKEVGTLRALLTFEPGIYAGDPKMTPTQTPEELEITGNPQLIFLAEVTADLRGVGALTSPP